MSQLQGLWGRALATAHLLGSSGRPGISLNKADGISLQMSYLGKAGVGGGSPPIPELGGWAALGQGMPAPHESG